MSITLDMLRAARLAPNLLLEAGNAVVEFLRRQFNTDGGAANRSGESDLYYTVFALSGLAAMNDTPPARGRHMDATVDYLRRFSDGADLDFVHTSCLARCWASMPNNTLGADSAAGILRRLETYRSADGGYGSEPAAASGTIYNCFLALSAYQDLDREMPAPEGMVHCLNKLRTGDGAFANEQGLDVGTTPTTAAAAVLMTQLGRPVPQEVADWLLARCLAHGGFLATPAAPFPDLLSTATALHALSSLDFSIAGIKDACIEFVESLWTGQAFCGHWADDIEDSEYTYYALLALGHLSK